MALLLSITFALTVSLTFLILYLVAVWNWVHWLGKIGLSIITTFVALFTAVCWIQLFFYLNDIGTSYVNYITV